MTDPIQVTTTVESREDAEALARALVGRRLAACVQVVGPIHSTYWWQGEVETAEEWACLIKTRRDAYPRIEAAISELHAYDTPEIMATPIVDGSVDYLSWIAREVSPDRS